MCFQRETVSHPLTVSTESKHFAVGTMYFSSVIIKFTMLSDEPGAQPYVENFIVNICSEPGACNDISYNPLHINCLVSSS